MLELGGSTLHVLQTLGKAKDLDEATYLYHQERS